MGMYTFEEIIGHDEIVNHLQNAMKTGKISHSYIFEGEEGIGKKLIANTFAKTLFCEENTMTPCNRCSSCIKYDSGNHPDVVYVTQTKKTGISVSDIREQINSDINTKPYQYPYKIYIVNNADKMTVQAQNALLKTIEEPPSYAIIILIAQNSNLFLQTIISRCIVLRLKQVAQDSMMNYLTNVEQLSKEKANIYTSFARGNIGKAIQLIKSEEFSEIRDLIIHTIDDLNANNEFEIIEKAVAFEAYKEQLELVFDILVTWLRDLLVIQQMEDERYIIHRDQVETIKKQGKLLSRSKIIHLINNIESTRQSLKVNVNSRLSFEMMLLNI
jgi:DNA polymerase-3 subunit delta'